MSKEPAIPQEVGEPSSRTWGDNTEPTWRPGTQSDQQAVQGGLHDVAGTSSAMAAQDGHYRRVTLQMPHPVARARPDSVPPSQRRQEQEQPPYARPTTDYVPPLQRRQEQPPYGRTRPYYVPPSRRRPKQEQPLYAVPAVEGIQQPGEAQRGRVGVPTPKTIERVSTLDFTPEVSGIPRPRPAYAPPWQRRPAGGVQQEERRAAPPPWDGAPPGAGLSIPGELIRTRKTMPEQPPYRRPGPYYVPPSQRRQAEQPTAESVHEPGEAEVGRTKLEPPRAPDPDNFSEQPHVLPPHRRHEKPPHFVVPGSERQTGRPSPRVLPEWKKNLRWPRTFCFFMCCILFWLLVIGAGVAVLVVYLLYHPQPPQLRVTTATLKSGHIDRLTPPRVGFTLNSDLRVSATIYNPNSKIDVVLRYMQLDLYFQDVMIGTTQAALWPPVYEQPGGSANRTLRLVVSNVRVSQEDAEVWHNATTTRGGHVQLQIFAMVHVQLNFGHWLPFRYWVYTKCSLLFDPPPDGTLRMAQCLK